ncbi:hypothetical protein SARC_05728 [Sphaeroforma arctica JP610]|uniref:Uncharacterized protein n=1 Tax=Sphaeroforma arctica JP610 TaxID=667725 RepID=A0A0L0FZC1_9EUKA|nr:hypothetical protein SARC_05728 [Sphaeroforma arctica JP610]KNC81979.1 hypothetical protein SARC_05728 [Sphaeroforma arctica JP610]|eukprot:XP_014155881.1 hypothetical protein SARC_05728 [Sphaeroforma arctica JP610]
MATVENQSIVSKVHALPAVNSVTAISLSYYNRVKEYNNYTTGAATFLERVLNRAYEIVAPLLQSERIQHVDKVLGSYFDNFVASHPHTQDSLESLTDNAKTTIHNATDQLGHAKDDAMSAAAHKKDDIMHAIEDAEDMMLKKKDELVHKLSPQMERRGTTFDLKGEDDN